MSEPFIAEIRIFAGNFNPRGWAFCNGSELPVAQNTFLFSILGTTYGGNGETTFRLPDLQGRAPMHPGSGPQLTPRQLGENGGTKEVTLTANQMPPHKHACFVHDTAATASDPTGRMLAQTEEVSYGKNGRATNLDSAALSPMGGGAPHNNCQPYLVLNFIIALTGIFPSRS